MSRIRTTLLQMARVGAAGFAALCIDATIYLTLLPHVELAALAALVGHGCGIFSHFLVSSRIVLRQEMSHIRGPRQQAGALGQFLIAGGCGMASTTAVVFIAVDQLGLHPVAGKAAAAAVSFLVVFGALKLLVLRDRGPAPTLVKIEI